MLRLRYLRARFWLFAVFGGMRGIATPAARSYLGSPTGASGAVLRTVCCRVGGIGAACQCCWCRSLRRVAGWFSADSALLTELSDGVTIPAETATLSAMSIPVIPAHCPFVPTSRPLPRTASASVLGSQVSVHPTKVSSVMAGMETPPGHRICLSRCDKVPILRKHRDESLVCASRTRVGCGHVSGLAACFSTAQQGGLEAGEHPVWVFPLSHKMTPFLYPNAQQPPQLAGVGCALAPRGFPGASSRSLPEPFFRTSPDCRDSRAA